MTSLSGTIYTSTPLEIGTDVTIDGPGSANLTIDSFAPDSVVKVDSGHTVSISGLLITQDASCADIPGGSEGGGINNAGTLSLSDVTVTGCYAMDVDGGTGGGIYSTGALTMNNCSVTNNTAADYDTANFEFTFSKGGGIYASGNLSMTNCTVANNTVNSTYSGSSFDSEVQAEGAGLDLAGSGNTMSLVNCTIANNSVSATAGGGGFDTFAESAGGGIQPDLNGTLSITNCTIAGNTCTATASGGGFGEGRAAASTTTATCTALLPTQSSPGTARGTAMT